MSPVFTIVRLEIAAIGSVTVAVLLSGLGSVTPAGGDTVTVLVSVPVAPAGIVPLNVNVTVPPLPRESPAAAVHTPVSGSYVPRSTLVPAPTRAGVVTSTIPKLVTELGPRFVTTISYVTGDPAVGVALVLCFAAARSAVGTSCVVTVDVSLPGFGSVTPSGGETVEVFTSTPVASGSIEPVMVKVPVPPASRVTRTPASDPVPAAGPLEPGEYVAFQLALTMPAGNASFTRASTTSLGPPFVTTNVYEIAVPGIAVAGPVFSIPRSPTSPTVTVAVAVP